MNTISKNTITLQKKFPKLTYNQLADTNLYVSEVGFGTYRVDDRIDAHKDALKKALLNGVNIIDTATNYADGYAEKAIGEVMEDCINNHGVKRSEIILVSKGGYIQGEALVEYKKLEKKDAIYPNLVKLSKDCYYCIHPLALNAFLALTMERMGCDTIDIFLLNNPECLLNIKNSDGETKLKDDDIESQIKDAFIYLEEEVAAKRIRYYGICSNNLALEKSNVNGISLIKCLEIAKSISVNHHFKVVQCPLNIFETNLVTEKINSEETLLDFSIRNNVAVLANRAFNTIKGNSHFRAARVPLEESLTQIEIEDCLQQLRQSENDLRLLFSKASAEIKKLIPQLNIHDDLFVLWKQQIDILKFKEVIELYTYPKVEMLASSISTIEDDDTISAIQILFLNINIVIKNMIKFFSNDHNQKIDHLEMYLDQIFPELKQSFQLTQKIVHLIRSTHGVTSTLIGMKREEYVIEILNECHIKRTKKKLKNDWDKLKRLNDIN